MLGGDGAAWLTTQILAAGTQGVALEFETGACEAVSFVLFAVKGAAVAARVSFPPGPVEEEDSAAWSVGRTCWSRPSRRRSLFPGRFPRPIGRGSRRARPARRPSAGRPGPRRGARGSRVDAAGRARRHRLSRRRARRAGGAETLPRQIAKWARGGTRYYCQKPWTDMSNFTVDGRVDVCCIATGASQEAYQLGNINRQSFQDIWNGPMARRFRRTVNGEDRLPPCARCPMSHAYNGLLFDPENTLDTMNVSALRLLRKRKLTWLTHAVVSFNRKLVDRVMFRGFKRRGNHVV